MTELLVTYLYAGVATTFLYKGRKIDGWADFGDTCAGVLLWPLIFPKWLWENR